MPAYHVDLITERGLQRLPFTLDDDRPLRSQLLHVLEELRQRGMIVQGGPEDELVVRWNGREIDAGQSPRAAGLSAMYPLELRMIRREFIAARREPPARSFLPKSAYLTSVAGLTGALVAWAIASTLTDLGDTIPTYAALDLIIAAILGAAVGAGVLGAQALRRAESAGAGLVLGCGLGLLGSTLGAFFGLALADRAGLEHATRSFVVARLLTWVLTGAFLGATLGLRWVRTDAQRIVDGAIYGAAGAAIGGLLMSLPGPTDFWQGLSFALVGAAVGLGASAPAAYRSVGVLALETASGRSVGLLRHREWELWDDDVTDVGGLVRIDVAQGRCTVVAGPANGDQVIALGGHTVTTRSPMVNEDVLTIGPQDFRFRRFPDGGT